MVTLKILYFCKIKTMTNGLTLGVCTMCGVKCSYVLEEYTASIFSVTELLQADAEVMQSKKCVGYVRSWSVSG